MAQEAGPLRDRLLLLLRLLSLHRSVDLSRTLRTASTMNQNFFVLVKRKGWTSYRWEEVPQVSGEPDICPVTIMKRYVSVTSGQGPPGGHLFLSLVPPYKPLTANTLGSLTKRLLTQHGIPPEWGPHSTRGAGVLMYKKGGLTSEQVCQIGQWKDIKSFTSHYLRLEAAHEAGGAVKRLVHKTSLVGSAEPELSRTPGKETDPGGRDNEGEAQSTSEVLLFVRRVCLVLATWVFLTAMSCWSWRCTTVALLMVMAGASET